MSRSLRLAFFAHSFTSDWNNGNAHFLRGLARALVRMGHSVVCWEERDSWSRENLVEAEGEAGRGSLAEFARSFPELDIRAHAGGSSQIAAALQDVDVAIVHEWNEPELVATLLDARQASGCRLLFHDTHHRASSSPAAIERLQVRAFDGVLAFGEALRRIYVEQLAVARAWTFHEAADTSVFFPAISGRQSNDVIWIGNWGDEERTRELYQYLVEPARRLADVSWVVHGVRYPEQGMHALKEAGIHFGGYISNLSAAEAYRSSRVTLHIPRQQYRTSMQGIPTIRVFEALASGIPLISAPWNDVEQLFRPGDYLSVSSTEQITEAIRALLSDPARAAAQSQRGLETVLARHTCDHRAQQLTAICEEVLA